MLNRDIKKIALHLIKKYNTQNPFKIADALKIEYIIGPMGHYSGCYLYLKKHRCIFLNDELSENEKSFVMAHELGHAILHRTENCYFIRNKTFLSTAWIEREANTFAAELLIPDSLIYENPGFTKKQLARLAGYNEKIMDFKTID
ncbi:Zn peptidase [Blautia argi]|uniref:Zn peptidase n=1 Tax=Blautia argi TaxID=1912897 RepID=A0A2Z4UCQ9_9FIRM|nr:Zn peptidase [Blautia argi]